MNVGVLAHNTRPVFVLKRGKRLARAQTKCAGKMASKQVSLK